MRFSQFVLVVAVAFVACCNPFTSAEHAAQLNPLEIDSQREVVTEGRRYLKGSKKTTNLDEERAAASPGAQQLLSLFKLPKVQALQNLPLLKQVAQMKTKFGPKVANLYRKWATLKFKKAKPSA
ncbi:hypothetical protein PHYPSEUDO_002442 [Phytophthora pseudosyringae]|uniref:RxLR effector protein n=1 Tax=Phytophthora pseudosyringae TaxID=221518 RepID=A0A8T1VWK2_9STRA|nr:hypothetical protein PHYPSEUDO_002442 [Phytophthora pseudosyringae]